MATCPYCAETIPADVSVCPYCESEVDDRVRRVAAGPLEADAGMRMLLPVGRSGWAIAAGYFGLFSFVIFPAPISLILGIVAIWHLKKNPQLHGFGRAIFGLVMGALGSLVLAFALIAALAGH